MPSFTPRSITIHEDNPASVDHYRISCRALDGTTELSAGAYPIDLSGDTTIPIGSNGLFDPIPSPDGTMVRLFVNSVAAAGHGDNVDQEAPDGPFTLGTLDDGAESIIVTL